jgi:two-component system, LytTR family, response regulator
MNTRVILIDDEADARHELRWLLSTYPTYTVVGEAATYATARQRLTAASDYDLVFLDVQLVGGNGFDLVPFVARSARIIFVTAFDQFALRAFEVNALDYLVKPIATERFAQSLTRWRGAPNEPVTSAVIYRAEDTALICTDTGDHFVPLTRISAILSNENYSDVLLRTGERLLTRRTLKSWEDALPAAQFRRVHRQALVNLACIEGHRRDTRETAELTLTGVTAPIPVSRAYLAELRPLLVPPEPSR